MLANQSRERVYFIALDILKLRLGCFLFFIFVFSPYWMYFVVQDRVSSEVRQHAKILVLALARLQPEAEKNQFSWTRSSRDLFVFCFALVCFVLPFSILKFSEQLRSFLWPLRVRVDWSSDMTSFFPNQKNVNGHSIIKWHFLELKRITFQISYSHKFIQRNVNVSKYIYYTHYLTMTTYILQLFLFFLLFVYQNTHLLCISIESWRELLSLSQLGTPHPQKHLK